MINEIVGFEHIHRHSDLSLLDGYGMVSEYAKYSKTVNQQYLCVTDHGMMACIPQQISECEKHGLKPIFGCEIYYNPNQPYLEIGGEMKPHMKDLSPEQRQAMRKSYHMTFVAKNEIGYKNLVRMTSWGWIHGFYYKPRVNWEQLIQHKEGIIVGSGCYNSPVGQAFDAYGEEAALREIEKYHNLFGENYYLEIMLLDFHKQKPYDAFLIKAHEKTGIPLLLTQDCHYCKKEDSRMQRLVLMVDSKRTVADMDAAIEAGKTEEYFELQDSNLWMKSEEELNVKWENEYQGIIDYELFKQAKQNSVNICRLAEGVKLDRSIKLPRFPDENERLKTLVTEGIKKRGMPQTNEYWSRVREEFQLVKEKEFSAYFIIQKMMTDAARQRCREVLGSGTGSEAVGPGRGSGAGFLLNYLLGITDVDPVRHDLLSARFLSPARGGKQMSLRFSAQPISKNI